MLNIWQAKPQARNMPSTKFFTSKAVLAVVFGIAATGVILNYANQGKLGASAKKLANAITSGYGAGNLPS